MWAAHATRPHPRPVPHHTHAQRDLASHTGWIGADSVPRREEAPQRLDRYGNDVSNAVATYTYDRAGIVYEEHSPQTEVPRLKPPTS
jgi:hypothetical protein